MSIPERGQVWIGDFIIGIGVFFVAILIFVVYLGNIADNAKSDITQLSFQAKLLSNYLVGIGTPSDWSNNPAAVQRIGLTDGESRIDWVKFNALHKLQYDYVKELLNTNYDFYVFFEDEDNSVLNIGGYCGFGSQKVFSNTSDPKLGWLGNSWEDNTAGPGIPGDVPYFVTTSPLTGEEITHVYRAYKPQVVTNAMNASTLFLYNLTQAESLMHRAFDIIYVEANTYNWSELKQIEDWVYNGGKLFLFDWWCNEKYPGCADGDSYVALGVNFSNTIDINYTTAQGFVPGIVYAIAMFNDPFLGLPPGLNLYYNGYPPNFYSGKEGELNAVQRLPNSSVFQGMGLYQNHTDPRYNVDIGSWSPDSPFSLAYWRFGTGWVYYFPMNRTMLCSDKNTGSLMDCLGNEYAPNSIVDDFVEGIAPLAGRCNPINTSLVTSAHLVTAERLLLYDDKFIKMVVYLWD